MSGLALRCMTVAHRVRMQGLYVRSGAQGAYHAGHAGLGAQNRTSGALMHADMSAQQVASPPVLPALPVLPVLPIKGKLTV